MWMTRQARWTRVDQADSDSADEDSDSEDEDDDSDSDESGESKPPSNRVKLEAFHAYYGKEETTYVRPLDVLKGKKSALNAFPEVLERHLKETGQLEEHETLGDTPKYKHGEPLPLKDLHTTNSSPATVTRQCPDNVDGMMKLLQNHRDLPPLRRENGFRRRSGFAQEDLAG